MGSFPPAATAWRRASEFLEVVGDGLVEQLGDGLVEQLLGELGDGLG